MKKYRILIFVIINFLSANISYDYNVTMYGIPVSNVTMNINDTSLLDKKLVNLNFITQSKQLISPIFKIQNNYQTIIDPETNSILSFKKSTFQPGIINEIETENINDSIFYRNSDIYIPNDYYNIFTLLFYLSNTSFEKVNTELNLEREGILYHCIISKNKIDNEKSVYHLDFIPQNLSNSPVVEHTDIFTWAIFKKGAKRTIIVENNTITSCTFKIGAIKLIAKIKSPLHK